MLDQKPNGNELFLDSFEESFNKHCNMLVQKVLDNRERLLEAFIAETGMLPSECILVEKMMPDGSYVVHVQRRSDPIR